MNIFERARFQCHLGIKAYQNVRASQQAFERLSKLNDSDDHLVTSSVFHFAVVRYAKPFMQTQTAQGSVRYPVKHLKNTSEFNPNVHEHLLLVRNTLIAHDDLDQVEPRALLEGMTIKDVGGTPLKGSGYFIPMSVTISNKCISHPADLDGASKMLEHVTGTLSGILSKLNEDLGTLRQARLDFPEEAEAAEKYQRNHDENVTIPAGGMRYVPPSLSDESWLIPTEPDFTDIHNGFRYETITLRREFPGPEKIKLPGGGWVEIQP